MTANYQHSGKMSAINATNHTDDDVNSSNENVQNATPHESRTNASQIDENQSFDIEELRKLFNVNASYSNVNQSFNVPHKRVKRVQIFRPLFVYRQELIKRHPHGANRRSDKKN